MSTESLDLPRRITLAAGGRREIPLPSYAGSGNAWSATPVSGEDVAAVTVETEPPPPPVPIPGGGPPEPRLSSERAIVSGLRVGHARWRLELARAFGPRQPTAVTNIDIEVTPLPCSWAPDNGPGASGKSGVAGMAHCPCSSHGLG